MAPELAAAVQQLFIRFNQAHPAELIQSWSAQAILLLLLGWLMLAPELYHKQSFRHHFGAIHRRHLQRQHLQYRFNQSYLSA